MKKIWYYITVATILSVVCVGCSREDITIPPPTTIDPPVNELLDKKQLEYIHTDLEKFEYEGKYIRKVQESIEFDTFNY